MAQVCDEVPRSAGKILDSEAHEFGLLRDSSGLLDDHHELRARLQADGYLYLKGFFPREDVLQVRKGILTRMREQDLILPSPDPLQAIANPERRTVFMPELAKNNNDLERLIYGGRVMGLYQS